MVKLSILSSVELLAKYCRKVYEKGLTPATSGNISLRELDRVYVTPTGCCLGDIESQDIVEMSLDGEKLRGLFEPSTEWQIHKALYAARPDITAVIHAHPTKATALAAAHQTIDQPLIAEVVISLGHVPLIPYTLPGTEALAKSICEHVGDAKAMLLANHGAIAIGKTIREAYFHLELLESLAEVYIIANSLPGGAKPLNPQQVQEIMAAKHGHAGESCG